MPIFFVLLEFVSLAGNVQLDTRIGNPLLPFFIEAGVNDDVLGFFQIAQFGEALVTELLPIGEHEDLFS